MTMPDDQLYRELFSRKDTENPSFWARFTEPPDFSGKHVLDVGSGLGAMCADVALDGAERVVGLDIKPELVDFARRHIDETSPEIAGNVSFHCMGLAEYDPSPSFDIIIAKNSFEHIEDPEAMLAEMSRRLKPGGRMFIGFGPLYNSINGAHMRRLLVPWGHLFLPGELFRRLCEADRGHEIPTLEDLHLNRKSYHYFRRIFDESGLETVSLNINANRHPAVKVMTLFRRIPFLREMFTVSMYIILRKP